MDDLRLKTIKKYMQIDNDEDDEQIKLFADAATSYLAECGVKENFTDARYVLVLSALTLHYYDNRCVAVVGNTSPIELGIRQIINQLKNKADDTP